ncbi:MAG: hypothetical protein Sv326_0250 [Candidatus Fermentimicrarchaeum limneticum]|uniref:Uncharacterized protein n=1 Tax=Fermentimicrarchaeum limneticum TaxID=2795018 RepID=A0A7D5XBK0_FERL1|nr:MAG: hypothetical protein Sv326_0250 [Candidatus Fermentimicrarchaeum limneticum]
MVKQSAKMQQKIVKQNSRRKVSAKKEKNSKTERYLKVYK